MINDVSALTYDGRSAGVVAASDVPVVLMHHQGAPETMQDDPRYDDVLVEVYLWLEERIEAAEEAGIARDRILIDPGFGFGKNVGHNLELMNGLALFHSLGCPLVVGASRKRTIGALVGRSAGRRAPRRKHRLRAQGGGAGRPDPPRPRRVRNRAGAARLARDARPGADSAPLGGGVDPEVAELAVERRAADPEAARDFGHPAAIMADREPDDVGFDLFERAQDGRRRCRA